MSSGEKIKNVKNGTNNTTDPNGTVPTSTPVITPRITITPSVTVPTPAPVMTPRITITPSVTVPAHTPVMTPNIIAEPNTTTVSTPGKDENMTQGTIPGVVPAILNTPILNTPEPTYTSKQIPDGTQTAIPIVINIVSANNSNQKGFFGDIYDKIIIAAILGLVGLFYEIIKIRYDNKQKAKLEKIDDDVQNELLKKLEKRQEKLLTQHGISDKRQDGSLEKSDIMKEDIEKNNRKT